MTLEPLPLEKHGPRDPHLILVRRDIYLRIHVFWQLLEVFLRGWVGMDSFSPKDTMSTPY